MQDQEVTGRIIGCAMTVHSTLGPGFLESVYQRALAHELRRAGLRLDCERAVVVRYDGTVVGDFSVDLFVEDRVIVELKAVQAILPLHEVQLVNYLTATGIDIGLLLNFGGPRLEFRRRMRAYCQRKSGSSSRLLDTEPGVPDV